MLGSIKLGLMIWAVAGPVLFGCVAYLGMRAREVIVIAGAVSTARNEEVSKCNDQRHEIGRAINASVDAGVTAAVEAARSNTATPSAPAELVTLCKADPNCRAREARP